MRRPLQGILDGLAPARTARTAGTARTAHTALAARTGPDDRVGSLAIGR